MSQAPQKNATPVGLHRWVEVVDVSVAVEDVHREFENGHSSLINKKKLTIEIIINFHRLEKLTVG